VSDSLLKEDLFP